MFVSNTWLQKDPSEDKCVGLTIDFASEDIVENYLFGRMTETKCIK